MSNTGHFRWASARGGMGPCRRQPKGHQRPHRWPQRRFPVQTYPTLWPTFGPMYAPSAKTDQLPGGSTRHRNSRWTVLILVARAGIEPATFRFSGGRDSYWPAVYLRLCVVCAAL